MARVAYGRNTTRVNTTSHPDDNTSPVGTNEWNSDPEASGLLGFTKITATLNASDVLSTKDDSATFTNESGSSQAKQSTLIQVECNGTDTTGAVVKIDITDTNINDIVYLFKATDGDTVTVTSHTGSFSANGQIKSLDGNSITLNDTGKPVSLMRRGNYWFEFGGGGGAADMAANTVKVRDANSSGSPSDKAVADTQILIGDGTGFTAAALSGDATMTNAGVVTIGTLNQDTTGSSASCTGNSATASTATTVSANAIGITQLAGIPRGKIIVGDASGDPALLTVGAEDTVLTVDANGDVGWEAPSGGGAHVTQEWTATTTPANPSTGTGIMYMKTIDSNNEGLFMKMRKNNQVFEVQIA